MPNGRQESVTFGLFEVNLASRELRKNGSQIKLQDQPFEVLAALIERPEEVVTRDELKERIWRDDTFVDFDHSLSEAINKIRRALGDSASNPRFIETVPRRGYRFIGASGTDNGSWWTKRWRVLATACAAAAVLPAAYVISGRVTPDVPEPPRAVPFTSYPGQELAPSFSPGGDRIAFTWNGEKQDNFDIYVKLIGAESQIRLTETPEDEFSPAWSPDGRQIAFLRKLSPDEFGVFLTPALGGAERQLASVASTVIIAESYPDLDWTRDGRFLVTADRLPGERQYSLVLIEVSSGEKHRVASVPKSPTGDYDIAFSPDGHQVVFKLQRFGELYRAKLTKDWELTSAPIQVTNGLIWPSAPAWTSDGSEIIFPLGSKFRRELWRMRFSPPASPERLPYFGADGSRPAVSADGRRLAYSSKRDEINIWRIELSGDGEKEAGVEKLISSTGTDSNADYSPDGSKIAFESNRSGSAEIWISNADGTKAHALTHQNVAITGSPRWSPKGDEIAFDSVAGNELGVYIVRADGGEPRLMATGFGPEWSPDGRSLYYGCRSPTGAEICRVSVEGGDPVYLTDKGGARPRVGRDGKWIYYARPDEGLRRISIASGADEPVLASVGATEWTLGEKGIYFISGLRKTTHPAIMYRSFHGGETRRVRTTAEPSYYAWLALSPDSRHLLYDQFEQTSSDIMLVENFR